MDQAKVKVIQDWPKPQKVKDVQSFLGFANFYHHFIFNYSDIVVLLTRLIHKGITFQFTNKARMAFTTLKEAFTTAPVLMHWIPDCPIVIETMPSPPFSPSSRKVTSYILSPSTPAHFLLLN